MSGIATEYNLDDIIKSIAKLITNLEEVFLEENKKVNVKSSRLGMLYKALKNIENYNPTQISKLIEIAIKYNAANVIFDNGIQFNAEGIYPIIVGGFDLDSDTDGAYNDFLFEFSFAARFIEKLLPLGKKIKMETVCDIILDDQIAIECKYIHSKNSLKGNVRTAVSQINKRIEANLAKSGFIALDLTNLIDFDEVNIFVQDLFSRYVKGVEILRDNKKINAEIIHMVITNRSFTNIIAMYVSNMLEVLLFSEIGFEYDLTPNTRFVFIQANFVFTLEHEGNVAPLPIRSATYFVDKSLPVEVYNNCCLYAKSLASGY